ncbi:MAG: DUF2806 domain-containing protein, partial [Polaribacter sp.]
NIDWAVDFFDIAQDCSDEYMQYIWAKLLAGEAEKPGKYSRRTIHLIKMMTQHEARVFSVICSCIWHFKDPYAGDELILILEDHYYRGHFFDEVYNFRPDDLENLENMGLLKLSYTELLNNEAFDISFFGKEHRIAHPSSYEFGYAGLSRSGEELFNLINPEPLMDFYDKSIAFLGKEKILIK